VGGKLDTRPKLLQESPNGGVWIIKIKRDDNIDKMWESTCFALIGKLQVLSEFFLLVF
jgi:glycine cleavage system H lipoate-binding protein